MDLTQISVENVPNDMDSWYSFVNMITLNDMMYFYTIMKEYHITKELIIQITDSTESVYATKILDNTKTNPLLSGMLDTLSKLRQYKGYDYNPCTLQKQVCIFIKIYTLLMLVGE